MSTVPSGARPATASGPTLTEEEQALPSASALIASNATRFFDFISSPGTWLLSDLLVAHLIGVSIITGEHAMMLPIPCARIGPPADAGERQRRPRRSPAKRSCRQKERARL